MNKAREQILGSIARHKARHRHSELPAHVIPQRALLPAAERLELFASMVRKSAASIESIGPLGRLPAAVQYYLQSSGMAEHNIYLNSPALSTLGWNSLASQDYRSAVGVSLAFCGIAETGSLVLLSAPAVSTAAWFLPENLIVAVAQQRIYATQEDCWARLHAESPELPRTVTFMTGPSRTGDIEQKIVIGAHGPKQLHIVLFDNGETGE
jgi:L-lactate dehydrogenase complex protein LldG